MPKNPAIDQRKHTRFQPKADTVANVILERSGSAAVDTRLNALILSESLGGCGLLLVKTDLFQEGTRCKVKLGNSPVQKAVVRWKKVLDDEAIKIGLMYVEKD